MHVWISARRYRLEASASFWSHGSREGWMRVLS